MASCHTVLCLPIPPCHSSSLPFAVFTAIPLGASLYQFPAGLQEPRKRQSGMMRFLKQASLSLWCHSPLPALIFTALYSPVPDGRLKSIFLPTEMCFPEHYIKPWSSVQSGAGGTELPARWHCCLNKKSLQMESCGEGKKNAKASCNDKNWWKI